jgi:hypothetical protein
MSIRVKILFICGSAEPGNDGVGDYTRRLCGELVRTEIDAQIISLCDLKVTSFTSQNQCVEETNVLVYRIPIATSNDQRFICVQDILNNYKPDWISLQFVPYSYNPKGLPFWLPSFLKKLQGQHKWHIMFHELWLGMDIECSFKHKCIGKLQKVIIKKIVRYIEAKSVNTQSKLYQFFLQYNNISAEVLPIFGNIPVTGVKKEILEFRQFVLFATIHRGAPFSDFVNDLMTTSDKFDKPIKFIFIGNNGHEIHKYITILENYNICYQVLGRQSENVISQILIDSDLGISTTPYFQSEKSGVYAVYKEHQIKIISVSRKWTPTKESYYLPQIIKYEKNNLHIIPMDYDFFPLSMIASQFISSISN